MSKIINNRTKKVLFSRMPKIETGNPHYRERKILQRWKEYNGEMFHDQRGETKMRKKSGNICDAKV